jgi:F-type H+-transporting ATPase subunit a
MQVPVGKAVEHVVDTRGRHVFEFPFGIEWHIPQPFGHYFPITKFMVLEVVVGVLMLAIFVPLGRRIRGGRPPRGRFWNMLEMVLLFVRDEMARPAIGRHEADRYVPFLWTMFFFVLFCNLFGLLPWAASPTAALAVTATLALLTFAVVIGSGMRKFGPVRYWIGLVPHMDVPPAMKVMLYLIIFPIEVLSLLIKHAILAVRLLANMFAGHLVLAVILGFTMIFSGWAWLGVAPVSVLAATALDFLELLVAFLQAYIFAFLAALFIGMALHQH